MSAGKEAPAPWTARVLGSTLLGGLLLAACHPPLELAFLLPFALIPWLSFVAAERPAGRRPWLRLYAGGALYHFLILHWLRLPHAGAAVGWAALSLYLACYVPLWAWIARTGVHRLSLPLWLAAPVAWMGCEWLRCTLLTGFPMACLGHALYRTPLLIQTADLGGAHLVGGLVVLTAVAVRWLVFRALRMETPRESVRTVLVAGGVLAAALGYGFFRLHETPTPASDRPFRVALLQGTVIERIEMPDADKEAILPQYERLSAAAAALRPDLIVWPEAIVRFPHHAVHPAPEEVWRSAPPPPPRPTDDGAEGPPYFLRRDVDREALKSSRFLAAMAARYGVPTLVGVGLVEVGPTSWRHFNASALALPDGGVKSWYRKVHLVMFGEYVPFAEENPWIYKLLPIGASQRSGPVDQPPMEVGNERIAVNICFESTIPTFIRSQVQTKPGVESPTILINQSNDGWFHRSSEVELHLACAVFRAIECRRVFLVASNAGASAHVDPCGRLLWTAPRGEEHMHVVSVRSSRGESWYLFWGDLVPQTAAAACLAILVAGRFAGRRTPDAPPAKAAG